jgi:hypothetical protein
MESSLSYSSSNQYIIDNGNSDLYETSACFGLDIVYLVANDKELDEKLSDGVIKEQIYKKQVCFSKTLILESIDKKQVCFSKTLILESIDNFLCIEHQNIYGGMPDKRILSALRDGFLLFNMNNKNTKFSNKQDIINFLNKPNISFEEKTYFLEIYLRITKIKDITKKDIDRLQALGHF